MTSVENRKATVAIDLGAQSCRVSLLRWNRGESQVEVIHRFPNAPISTNNGLRWDAEAIFDGIMTGLRACAAVAPEGIASVGVDGWAVDYVRLDNQGNPVALPFCYRDPRTEQAEIAVHSILPPERLYAITGIQILRINTLYQLYADKLVGCDPRLSWLNFPEYFTFRLCGKRVSEYTNATHTGLVQLGTHFWSQEIFRELALNIAAAPEIVRSGSVLGPLTGDLARLPAYRGAQIVAPACHDTASAISAIPATGDDWAFISSGTWSLVGTVLNSPCVGGGAQQQNFTNLGGPGGKILFLKNVNGMWLLRQCLDEWEQHGFRWTVSGIVECCSALPAPEVLIDVDDPNLMIPGNTLDKINAQLQRLGHPVFVSDNSGIPALANTIFHSLAARYADVLSSIGRITGKTLKRLFIVGGGSKNGLLNRLTAQRTGLEVIPGSVEGSSIGNFAIQLAALEHGPNAYEGATAAAIAKWAERLSAASMILAHDDGAN
jgi:rhamnulokinase